MKMQSCRSGCCIKSRSACSKRVRPSEVILMQEHKTTILIGGNRDTNTEVHHVLFGHC